MCQNILKNSKTSKQRFDFFNTRLVSVKFTRGLQWTKLNTYFDKNIRDCVIQCSNKTILYAPNEYDFSIMPN